MFNLKSALLYTALCGMANAAIAETDLSDLRTGDMRKLAIHSTPIAGSDVPFLGEDGAEMTLEAYAGKHVVLNFWATWCAPCRHEMPMLADLQTQLGSDTFAVVTVATGRNPRPAIDAFFAEIGVENLPKHTDARQSLARSLGVLGLPVTIILDPTGQEIARLQGDADWSGTDAITILQAIMETSGS